MLKNIFPVILLAVCFFLSRTACAQSISVESIDDFSIKEVKENQITVGFTANIENTSNKNIKVVIKRGKLYKNDKYVGSFELVEKFKIPKHSKEEIPIQVVVKTESGLGLLKDGLSMLMGNSVKLKATGVVKGSWFIFWKKEPFEVQEKISLRDVMGL